MMRAMSSQDRRPPERTAVFGVVSIVAVMIVADNCRERALSGRSGASGAAYHALIPPIMVDGHRFYALVVTQHGDLDNKLKTLFDWP
jgi:hypothetical protein